MAETQCNRLQNVLPRNVMVPIAAALVK